MKMYPIDPPPAQIKLYADALKSSSVTKVMLQTYINRAFVTEVVTFAEFLSDPH